MTTVFLSGSRTISRLNGMIRDRIRNMVDQEFRIIVGDANGADKALQGYLAETRYGNVTVFCAGDTCRNNIGGWQVKQIQVDPKLKGRDFYTQKDKEMAAEADYGFVLWDGKSSGSINNIFELLIQKKSIVVYLSTDKIFTNISNPYDVQILLRSCNEKNYLNINKKINIVRRLGELNFSSQGALNL
jgi:hypothetical protein